MQPSPFFPSTRTPTPATHNCRTAWRWIFYINIPIGALSLLLTTMLIHDPPYLLRKGLSQGLKIDYIGFGLLALGLGSLEVVMDEGQRQDWFASHFILTFAVLTAVCLIGVVLWELRQKDPVIDFHILKDRNYTLATASMLLLGFVLYASTALLPLFLQTLLGYTALLSGMALSPGGIAICVCLPMVGMLMRRVEARWLVVFGVLVSATGLWMMSHFTLYIDLRTAMYSRIVQSLGLAFLFVPISTVAFRFIPRERTNYAAGLFNLARNIGGSSGIATVTTMLARRSEVHQQTLSSHLTAYDPAYRQAIEGATRTLQQHGSSLPDAMRQAQGIVYGTVLRQSSMLAFADAFWFMALLFILIVPLMFLMKSVPPAREVPKYGH